MSERGKVDRTFFDEAVHGDRAAVPVADGVEAVCGALGLEPWHVTASGTLVVAVDDADADAVVDVLQARGTPAAVVGAVRPGEGVTVDGQRVDHPDEDPSWAAETAESPGEAESE